HASFGRCCVHQRLVPQACQHLGAHAWSGAESRPNALHSSTCPTPQTSSSSETRDSVAFLTVFAMHRIQTFCRHRWTRSWHVCGTPRTSCHRFFIPRLAFCVVIARAESPVPLPSLVRLVLTVRFSRLW